jgi:hypothetical protein
MASNNSKRGAYKRRIDTPQSERDKYDTLHNREITAKADQFLKARITGQIEIKQVETRQIKYWHSKQQADIPSLKTLLIDHTVKTAKPILDRLKGIDTPPMVELE